MDFSLAHEEHETQLLSHSLNRGGISNLAAINVRELETGPLLVVLNNSGRALVLTGKGRVDLEPKTKYGVLTCLSTLESIKIARLGLVGQQVLLAPNYPKMPDIQACFAVDPIWSGVSKGKKLSIMKTSVNLMHESSTIYDVHLQFALLEFNYLSKNFFTIVSSKNLISPKKKTKKKQRSKNFVYLDQILFFNCLY